MRIEVVFGVPPVNPLASRFAYECDEPVAVGDIVLVAGELIEWLHPSLATVVSLTSNYAGPVKTVLRVVERAAP